jgi:hypothetical protein
MDSTCVEYTANLLSEVTVASPAFYHVFLHICCCAEEDVVEIVLGGNCLSVWRENDRTVADVFRLKAAMRFRQEPGATASERRAATGQLEPDHGGK